MPSINFIEKYSTIRDLGLHKHSYWEIIYVIASTGKFAFSDGSAITYNKGDVICIPPEILHQNFPNAGFQNINLTLINWTPSCNKPTLISNLESLQMNYVDDLYYILELTYRYFHNINQNQEIIDNLINLLLSFIDSVMQSPTASITTKIIESKIISNFTDPLFDLDSVYSELPYSKRHLQRLFIQERNISPLQFLTQQRLNSAIKYLSQTIKNNYSISDIAELCGFCDQYYFSRIFKNQFGTSPKNYQKTKTAQVQINYIQE